MYRYTKCTASVATSGENINVTWSPDGNTIAVGNRDDVVSFIDTRKHKVIKTTKFPFEVNEIKWVGLLHSLPGAVRLVYDL